MAGRPKSVTNSKVFDVAKPAGAKPLATSRPVIVGRVSGAADKTILVKTDDTDDAIAKKPLAAPSVGRKIISPISSVKDEVYVPLDTETTDVKSDEVALEPTEKVPDLPATAPEVNQAEDLDEALAVAKVPTVDEADLSDSTRAVPTNPNKDETEADVSVEDEDTPSNEVDTSRQTELKKPADNIPETQSEEQTEKKAASPAATETTKPELHDNTIKPNVSESAGIEALAEASGQNSQARKAEAEQEEMLKLTKELVESKKYTVPIDGPVDASTGKALKILLIVLLLGVVSLVVLQDAGLVNLGIKLPFDLIK